jgi:hypothetical protein
MKIKPLFSEIRKQRGYRGNFAIRHRKRRALSRCPIFLFYQVFDSKWLTEKSRRKCLKIKDEMYK